MTTSEHGWESITDAPCPRGCGGTVRWAEAGYVPGYRCCDLCDARYIGDPSTGRLCRRPGRAKRVTAARIAARARSLEAAQRNAAAAVRNVYGRSLREADLRGTTEGGSHGACLCVGRIRRALAQYAVVGLSDAPEAIEARARYGAELAAAETIERAVRGEVEHMTEDAVMICGPGDGWVWRERPSVHLTRDEMRARRVWR